VSSRDFARNPESLTRIWIRLECKKEYMIFRGKKSIYDDDDDDEMAATLVNSGRIL
jgi:hypothetical protein